MEQGSVAVVLDGHLDSRPGFGSWFSCQFFTFFPRELAVAMENTWQRTKALRLILGDLATRNAAIAREESVTGEPVGGGDAAEGMRQVQAEIEFGGSPALQGTMRRYKKQENLQVETK